MLSCFDVKVCRWLWLVSLGGAFSLTPQAPPPLTTSATTSTATPKTIGCTTTTAAILRTTSTASNVPCMDIANITYSKQIQPSGRHAALSFPSSASSSSSSQRENQRNGRCPQSQHRRTFIGRWILGGSWSASMAATTIASERVWAVQGAAELDLEYYLRDLWRGNPREGPTQASRVPSSSSTLSAMKTKQAVPRSLTGPMVALSILSNDCSRSCLCTQTLLSFLPQSSSSNRLAQLDPSFSLRGTSSSSSSSSTTTTATTIDAMGSVVVSTFEWDRLIQESVQTIRDKTRSSFQLRARWAVDDVSDPYYFDFTAYAFYKTAARLLPDYVDRDKYQRRLGHVIYMELLSSGALPLNRQRSQEAAAAATTTTTTGATTTQLASFQATPLTATLPCLNELLSLLVRCGFCSSYQLGESRPTGDGRSKARRNERNASKGRDTVPNNIDVIDTSNDDDDDDDDDSPLFDNLDDDAFVMGIPINALISIRDGVTLGACLQITGESSRFVPDFVGTLLAAFFEERLPFDGCQANWETYFVDPEYRPNPKDYFPNEQLIQLTLVRRA